MSAALRVVPTSGPEGSPLVELRPICEWEDPGRGCVEVLPVGVLPGFDAADGGWTRIDGTLVCPRHAPALAKSLAHAALTRRELAAGIPERFVGLQVSELELAAAGEERLAEILKAWRPGDPLPWITGCAVSGKTSWAALFARRALSEGLQVVSIDEPTLKQVMHRESEKHLRGSIIDDLVDADLAIIEDLGLLCRPSDWYWDKVDHVLNQRWARKRPVLVTTTSAECGSAPTEIWRKAGEHGDRVVSRLRGLSEELEVRLAEVNRRFAGKALARG